ncbi:hypothetical protein [Corynebacterium ulceribovis]|uniref:hypothetical protein n=1 Tax=Corynebacterium ulceribovis TaxID=487732 RepID=UPI000380B341|nr:hypothetical protein [Corynebacterium ulceribovis]
MTTEVALSQGARMLTGAGIVELATYGAANCETDGDVAVYQVVAHGLDHLGRLIVACDLQSTTGSPEGAVRLSISTVAPEFCVNIVAANLEAVGQLQWEDTMGSLRYGVIHLTRVFMHGAGNPIGFDYDEMLASALNLPEIDTDALRARDVVGRLTQRQLRQLADGVRAKEILGVAMTSRAEVCAHRHRKTVFIADISEIGLLLMELRTGFMQLTLVRFPQRVRTFAQLDDAVRDLGVLASVRN